jgi:hypothetical protein
LAEKPEGKKSLEDLGIDGWIMLNWISRQWVGEAWTGPMCVRIGTALVNTLMNIGVS